VDVFAELARLGSLVRQLQGVLGSSPPPAARVYNSANISINASTFTALTFNSERYDNGSLHSTSANTGRLTAPITGLYLIGASVEWAGNTTGDRFASIQLNGATTIARVAQRANAGAGNTVTQEPGCPYQLTAGDYVEVVVIHDAGVALNVLASGNYSPEFWMVRLPS
jgi:hypothetical protein